MREFVIIDNSKFPIAIAIYQNFIPTHEEFVNAQTRLEDFANHHENYVIIIDLSAMPSLPYEYRISQAKWIDKNNPLFVRQKARAVYYTPSITSRIMIKGVLMFSSLKIPYTVVGSLEKANAWADKQLKRSNAGITIFK